MYWLLYNNGHEKVAKAKKAIEQKKIFLFIDHLLHGVLTCPIRHTKGMRAYHFINVVSWEESIALASRSNVD